MQLPESIGDAAKYAYFLITYTLLNAVFYTANNIVYSTLTSLITKNGSERVQMGSIRFIYAFSTSLFIQWITVDAVEFFGGGTSAWKIMAIIYTIIGLVVNTISVFSVKELPEQELKYENPADDEAPKFPSESYPDLEIADKTNRAPDESKKLAFRETIKVLFKNKYYLIICMSYIFMQTYTALSAWVHSI